MQRIENEASGRGLRKIRSRSRRRSTTRDTTENIYHEITAVFDDRSLLTGNGICPTYCQGEDGGTKGKPRVGTSTTQKTQILLNSKTVEVIVTMIYKKNEYMYTKNCFKFIKKIFFEEWCEFFLFFKSMELGAIRDSNFVFRWFKFTLKPSYSTANGNLSLAIWDTFDWNFLSNLDTWHLETYPRTYYGHF